MLISISVSSTSSRFGDASPFKVQVNFDIALFEVQIDVHSLDKWFNVLEGNFFVHKFFDKENRHLCTPQGCLPCQKLMGNLLEEKLIK